MSEMGDCNSIDGSKDNVVSCDEVIKHLFIYIDSELEVGLQERLEAHVNRCSHCQDSIEAERHVRIILKTKCCDKAPEDLCTRIRSQLLVLNQITIEGDKQL